MTTITALRVEDVRFPTSLELQGSDAMNQDPDYSAAYVILETDRPDLRGYGLTFTIGRGNEICCAAIRALEHKIVGVRIEDIYDNMGVFWRHFTSDSQLRWIGPEKGAIQLATSAVVNAVWDLWAKLLSKPLWQLVAEMSPEELVRCIDFRYITDCITPQEAITLLKQRAEGKEERLKRLLKEGYPCYTTSAGWLGYSDNKLRCLCQEAVDAGFSYVKLKVGRDLSEDIRRVRIVREVIGPSRRLMIDANQVWEVNEAILWVNRLAFARPWFIEEPTSPDDVEGHRRIRERVHPVKVATGEMCQNRITFKQFIMRGAVDIVQIDPCRLGGVNEVLSVMLMAAKYNLPVCPHAGGVGLCEYVQHISMIDYLCIAATHDGRVIEYVDHLHENFVDPCVIKGAAYMPPTLPGYSIEMHLLRLNSTVSMGDSWMPHAMRIDAHQHYWCYHPKRYPWINEEMMVLQQDFGPAQLQPLLQRHGFDGSLVVQARHSEQETFELLAQAEASEGICGVVGWLDITAPQLAQWLDELEPLPALRGFRHQVQDESQPASWLMRQEVVQGMQILQRKGYVYEILVTHRDLAAATQFASQHDNYWLVLDHLGKPDIARGVRHWVQQIRPMAAMPHVTCKLSGLITEASGRQWKPQQLLPFFDAALEVFGSQRLMFGSDWPVCLLAGDYLQVYQLCELAISRLAPSEKVAIWGGTACQIYSLTE